MKQQFVELSKDFFVDTDFAPALGELGLTSIDAVFDFNAGRDLAKPNLAKHRTRIQFDLTEPATTLFLKRYDRPPILTQLKNWLHHRKHAPTSTFDIPAEQLDEAGIKTPKTVAHGRQWRAFFEKRSFIITEKIKNAESLERKLPDCFLQEPSAQNTRLRRDFIHKLADFARCFHQTGFRHCDFYLAHIFLTADQQLYLIDLQRTFKPALFDKRFRIKDITQLHYSAPGRYVSQADRLRFYLRYADKKKLSRTDRRFIRAVNAKAWRMADHDIKHNRPIPFAS